MGILRPHQANPLISPSDVPPSREGYRVLGSFNPAAVSRGGETLLLLRVAEGCEPKTGTIRVPYYCIDGENSRPEILEVAANDPEVELKDTRGVVYQGTDYLSTMSHIRLARSEDGVHFTVDPEPFIRPTLPSESFGVEDARVSRIGDEFYINYTGVSPDGYCTLLARTRDFRRVEKRGIILPPLNKDVAVFEEKIGGFYYCLHRPHNEGFGRPSIWLARSRNLLEWGDHVCLLRPADNRYESMKIGGGAPPIKTDAGWLTIYHGKGENQRYSLNTLLLDLHDPSKIIGQGETPCLEPTLPYETDGFFGNVVFTNGVVVHEGTARVYYGASDETACMATASVDELTAHALGRNG